MALITTAARSELVALFIGMFNAAPGATNLNAMVSAYESGQTVLQIAKTLQNNPAFNTVFPPLLTAQEFANKLANNLLGTEVVAAAKTWATDWVVGRLNAGVSRAEVILIAVQTLRATTNATYANAKAALANEVSVAEYYSIDKLQSDDDLGDLQTVIAGVTSSSATVTTAKALIDGGAVSGEIFTLSTGVDTVNAQGLRDVVNGIGDAAGTYTTGDTINGNAGTLLNLILNNAGGLGDVNGVGTVNVNLLASTSLNTALYTGVGAIWVNSAAAAGSTLTVENADLATAFGVSSGKQTSLDINYNNTAGLADTAMFALSGAGTATTARATIDPSSADTIEGVTLATTGSNFITLIGGTGAKAITVSGTGVNNIDVTTSATTLAYTSTSTGNQTVSFASGSISVLDTITMGAGTADQVTANASTFAKMTGVETFVTTINGGVSLFDGSNVTGMKTMTINQGTASGAGFFANMKGELTTLNVNGPTLTQDVSYLTGTDATLAVNYGAGTTAFDTSFNGLTVDEVKSLAVTFNVGGIAAVSMSSGTIELDKTDTTSLTLTQAGSDDDVYLYVDKADALDNLAIRATGDNSTVGVELDFNTYEDVQGLKTLEITASGIDSSAYLEEFGNISWSTSGIGANYSVTDTTNAMSLTSVNITASGADSSAYMNAYIVNVGDIAEFNITASGDDSSAYMNYTVINVGDVGTINVIASGASSTAYFSSYVSVFDGDVGTVNVIASGADSSAYFDSTLSIYRGDLGTVNITASGADSYAYMDSDISVYGGDVGDINITASGADSSAYLDGLFVHTGDVGTINVLASGNDSSAYLYYGTVTGDVGSISLIASGDSASAYAYDFYINGDLGSVSLLASGDSSDVYFSLESVTGDIGTLSVVASGDSASAYLYTDLYVGGNVGSVTVTASGSDAEADFTGYYMYIEGNLGPVNVTASGQDAWASMNAYVSGTVQPVTVTASGAGASASVELYQQDNSMNLLSLAVNATGANSWAGAYIDTGTGGILGNVTIQATKANSAATLDFVGNTFATITATTSSPSASINLTLENNTTAGGVVTASGSGTLYVDIQNKSITSLLASGQTNAVTVVANGTTATGGMTLTTGSFADNVMGGKGVDTFSLGSGADTFNFTNIADVATVASAATDIVAAGFTSASDKFDFDFGTAGNATTYLEVLTAAASLAALITAADTALDGTLLYYFGVVGTDGYLAADLDGTGVTHLIKLTGIVDMAAGDILA